jgi:hypothetical protein
VSFRQAGDQVEAAANRQAANQHGLRAAENAWLRRALSQDHHAGGGGDECQQRAGIGEFGNLVEPEESRHARDPRR